MTGQLDIRQKIDDILVRTSSDAKTEAIEALIPAIGWEPICDYFLDILRDDSRANDWRDATHVFWGAVLDRRSLPSDELIALLRHRFDPEGNAENNEVWSIASKLKGKSYLSPYKPLEDAQVLGHLKAIRDK